MGFYTGSYVNMVDHNYMTLGLGCRGLIAQSLSLSLCVVNNPTCRHGAALFLHNPVGCSEVWS